MALHLCQHAVVQHRTRLGLRPLCDLAQVTETWGRAERDELARRAVEHGLSRLVTLMLALAKHALGLAAPSQVYSTLRLASGTPPPDGLV
jgi:hypothetical protein